MVYSASRGPTIVSAQLSLKQVELDQSINKCNALEERFKELTEREESWERRKKKTEKLWLEKEDALMKKASKAEEESQYSKQPSSGTLLHLKIILWNNVSLNSKSLFHNYLSEVK